MLLPKVCFLLGGICFNGGDYKRHCVRVIILLAARRVVYTGGFVIKGGSAPGRRRRSASSWRTSGRAGAVGRVRPRRTCFIEGIDVRGVLKYSEVV